MEATVNSGTFAYTANKLLSQMTRGLITRDEYLDELKHEVQREEIRIVNETRPWVLVELSPANDNTPRYFDCFEAARLQVSSHIHRYGQLEAVREHVGLDGKGRVYSFKDGDGDAVTFVIEYRNISQ